MDACPECHSDLRGEPIPPEHFLHHVEVAPPEGTPFQWTTDWNRTTHMAHEEQMKLWGRCHCLPYGDRPEEERFFSRKVGYDIRGVYDGVLIWGCPDCGHFWPRFSMNATYRTLHLRALEIIEQWKIIADDATRRALAVR